MSVGQTVPVEHTDMQRMFIISHSLYSQNLISITLWLENGQLNIDISRVPYRIGFYVFNPDSGVTKSD